MASKKKLSVYSFPLICSCGNRWEWKATYEVYCESKPACAKCGGIDVEPDHSNRMTNFVVSVPFKAQRFHCINGYAGTKRELYEKAARMGRTLYKDQTP